MGKKRAAVEEPQTDLKQADAIREVMQVLGNDVKPLDAFHWILKQPKYAHLGYAAIDNDPDKKQSKVNSLNSSISTARSGGKKKKASNGGSSEGPQPLTAEELVRIKGIISEEGEDEIRKSIALVKRLGDLARFEEALSFLDQLK